MRKAIFGSIGLVAFLAALPASAQTTAMDCTDANMTKASADMEKMPAGEKKTMAMKEMSMAKDMMAKKDMAGCKTHMTKTMEMMK